MKQPHYIALNAISAAQKFKEINTNPDNSYISGYEYLMNKFPIIEDKDTDFIKDIKLKVIKDHLEFIAYVLNNYNWPFSNQPSRDKFYNRVILGIDKNNGAELVLLRWNIGETPIHGHAKGTMAEYLISGEMEVINYKLVDSDKKIVEYESNDLITSGSFLSVASGEIIHKFIAHTPCISLHLIPGHPKDGKGNTYTETIIHNQF